jgi:hypothetical protein
MKYGRCISLLLLLLSGCALLPPPFPPLPKEYPSQTEVVHLALPADAAYTHAALTLTKFGGTIVSHHDGLRIIHGEVKEVIIMTIAVEPEGTGSCVTVTGSVKPAKYVTGEFYEVHAFTTLLQAPPR